MSVKDWRPDPDVFAERLEKFVRHYLETALWSSMDEEGRPLDRKYSVEDFSIRAIREATQECKYFVEQAGDLLDATGASDSQNAHDFLLTRNRHGAGFWDRGYDEELGKKLTEIAHGFGEAWIYVSDNGKLYFS